MTEPAKNIIVREQPNFDLHDVLNPVEIEINDDSILNILKKQKYLL